MDMDKHKELERPAYSIMIADMEPDERPRERLLHYGAKALANRELLAILLRTGVRGCSVLDLSDRLMKEFGGLAGLSQASATDSCSGRTSPKWFATTCLVATCATCASCPARP